MSVRQGFGAVVMVLGLLGGVVQSRGAGMWQGQAPPQASVENAVAAVEASRFLVRDTGGSGGMFGRGDIRQKLLDVAFWSDGMHGVACGVTGAFYTDDGGITWRRIRQRPRKEYGEKEGQGVMYYQVELSGPEEIWLAEGRHPAVGRHLWHSTDAGASWEDAADRFPGEFRSVWDLLARGRHVWLLGGWAKDASYRSDDGGRSWSRISLPEQFEPFEVATPTGEPADALKTVYLLGTVKQGRDRLPRLLRSDDGGANWRRIELPKDLPLPVWRYRIAFATPEVGMIGLPAPGLKHLEHGVWKKDPAATASVLVTTDGGDTWAQRDLPDEELLVTALWGTPDDPRHFFAGVWNGFLAQKGGPRNGPALYETFDGGSHWLVAIHGKPQINAITGLDGRRVWGVGDLVGFAANDAVAILSEPGGPVR